MTEVRAQLGKTRLLTVTGSGGSGKTRLCLQIAADSLEQFPDGVWFVEFAALADPSLVPQAVASMLGIIEEPGKPITRTLSEHLKHKRLLLLLDNCEHLLDVCANLADTLLRQCPGVQVLASSREALGISGEQTYGVPSLSLPDRKEVQTPQTLSTYESVQLFIDRALAVRADFLVTNRNAPALASLCHHLDGIPLAIELAAARVRSLAVEEIDGRLDQRFRLLTGGSRTALPRHQTLRSLVDWSYDLLHDAEKLLLQRLSVFVGGWTLVAAERVCAGQGAQDWETLDLLTSLSDKSLVVAEENDGQYRYRLLETVRQYARDRLGESGGDAAVRERHRDYFLALVEEVDPKLAGAQQAEWLQHLEAEHENLRAGLNWSLEEAGSVGGLRVCGALRRFWVARGHLSEGRAWCERMLSKTATEQRTQERAKTLDAAGELAFHQSDYPAARALNEESLAIKQELGDRTGTAASLSNLGVVALDQGDYPAARARHEESLEIRRELGDPSGITNSLRNLGFVAYARRDFGSARALYEESLAIGRDLGDRGSIAKSLSSLGIVIHDQGDFLAARALHEESLAINRELGDRRGVAFSLAHLGILARDQGDYRAARAWHEDCLTTMRQLGDHWGIAHSLEDLGIVAHMQGDNHAARARYEEAIAIWRELGDRRNISQSLNGLGCVAYEQGDFAPARALHEESLAIRQELGNREDIAASLNDLGDVTYEEGGYPAARALYEESLTIYRELNDGRGIAFSLDGLAAVIAVLGGFLRAARIWGAAERIREDVRSSRGRNDRPHYKRHVAAARARVRDDAAFDQAWQEGRALTLEQTIKLALEKTVPRP